jgi:hypothetical protein
MPGEDQGLKLAQANISKDCILKIPKQRRDGGLAGVVECRMPA